MLYLRKIEEVQWKDKMLHDAVSISDLKTNDNDISVWKDDGTPGLINKLALAFSLTTGRIKDLWCVDIPDNLLGGFCFHSASSSTIYTSMQSLHTNIVVSTLHQMGELAEIIYNLIKDRKQIYISEQELKECFYNAIMADEITIDFNDKRFRQFRKPLAEIEKVKGKIDFSTLRNAKEVENNRVPCPKCKGTGFLKKHLSQTNKNL